LDGKYKQKHRIANARKQKRQLESQVNDNLAQVTTLNQDEEEEKKEIIMVDVDGRTFAQKDKGEQDTTTKDLDTTTDRTFVQSSYQSQSQREREQELKKTIESSSQLDVADKIVIAEGISSTHKYDNEDNILSFEFPINYKDLQNYMTRSYSNAEDNIKVWFNGRVNLKTGEVISSNLGRRSSSQAASG
jgi:predicted secreted protein